MNRNKRWKLATVVVVGFLLLSLNPEVRLGALLIEAVGLETIFLAFQAQIVVVVGIFYRQRLSPLLNIMHTMLEKLDPLYFRPKLSMIRAYPRVVLHSVPFLVTAYVVAVGTVLLHA